MTTKYLSIPRFVKGKLFSILENVLNIGKISVDSSHAGYTFIGKTEAINFRSSSSVGIFKDVKGKKYFIKNYGYTLKDLEYEYLHNEINTLKILNEKSLPHANVGFAKLVNAEDRDNRITLITEYADGNTLDKFSPKVRQKVITDVLSCLSTFSKTTKKSLLDTIPLRSQILTYVTFPFYLLRAITKEPSNISIFAKSSSLFWKYAPKSIFKSAPYGLSHRDLSVDNIIYNSDTKNSTILDTECMVRADILTDVAMLPRLFIRYLSTDQIISIILSLKLSDPERKRLNALMVSACIVKIATESKNTRDYINAKDGLSLVINTIVPELTKFK